MKKTLVCLLSCILLSMTLFVTSCGGPTPEKTVEGFINAMANGDIDAAEKYVTEDSKKIFALLKMAGTDDMKEEMAELKKAKIKNVKLDGEKATVTLGADDEEDTADFNLVKVDGEWKLDLGGMDK